MGTHHGGNGGNVPPDGDRSPDDPLDLPELPPEWGEITIPDDLSDLANEAEQIRQELAEKKREAASSLSLPDSTRSSGSEPSVGVPLLIMSVAVLITLVSLFAMAWSGSGSPDRAGAGPGAGSAETLPSTTLLDGAGRPVPVAAHTPMALLLIEECTDCATLIAATVAAAPAGVTVAAIGHSAPAQPPGVEDAEATLLRLADPNETLRTELDLGAPANAATVVLVDRDQYVVRTVPTATTVGQFQADLVDLGR